MNQCTKSRLVVHWLACWGSGPIPRTSTRCCRWRRRNSRPLFEHGPVKHVIVIVVQRAKQYTKQLAQVHVVGRLVETQSAAVVEVHRKFRRESLAQHLDRRRHLLLADLLVLLLLRRRFQVLPRQRTAVEVHQNVAHRLHVVAPALLDAEVRVNAGVACRPSQVLVLAVRYVLPRVRVTVLLREAEVDDEQFVAVPADAHDKVVGLDVAMNEVLAVDVLDAADHLVRQHQHRLHRETPRAEIEEILEAGPEQFHDKHIVVSNLAIPADVRDADAALENLVQLALVQQLWMSCFYWLQLYCHLVTNHQTTCLNKYMAYLSSCQITENQTWWRNKYTAVLIQYEQYIIKINVYNPETTDAPKWPHLTVCVLYDCAGNLSSYVIQLALHLAFDITLSTDAS